MLFLDALLVPVSLWIGYAGAEHWLGAGKKAFLVPQVFWILTFISIPILWLVLWYSRLYESMRQKTYYEIMLAVVESAGYLLVIFSAVLFYTNKQYGDNDDPKGFNVSVAVIIVYMTVQGCLVIFQRYTLKYGAGLVRKKGMRNLRCLLVVGIGQKALEYHTMAQDNPHWGYWVVGFLKVHEDEAEGAVPQDMILGTVDDIDKVTDEKIVDEVTFAISVDELPYMGEAIRKCEEVGLTFHLAADFLDTSISRIELKNIDGKPILSYSSATTDLLAAGIKRAFDIVFSLTIMILGSPVFLGCALAVRLTSKGPVFFAQKRVSLNGRTFNLYKFRSMVEGAEQKQEALVADNEMAGPVFKIKNDPRTTKVGKWLRRLSLDELPQFLNVLKGDMSVVGPRPLPTYEVARFQRWQRRRLSMKPGLTCIWQIKGRNQIKDFDDWMKLDLEYIDNWRLSLDWKIVLWTIPVIFLRRGAH